MSGLEAYGQKEASGVSTLTATCAGAAKPPSAIAGCRARSKRTILPGKSPTCGKTGRTRKSSKTSEAGSTSSAKVCVPYWNGQCAERSSKLWLPTATDWRDLASNSSNSLLVRPVAQSWFSTRFLSAPKPSLGPTSAPLFTSSLAGSTAGASMRAKRIRIYPTASQKRLFKQWFGVSRLVFNKTAAHLKQPGTKANWKVIKGPLLAELPEFCAAVPYQIKSIAIKDACKAVSAAKRKFRETGEISEVRFRSRKAPSQSCYIPGSAVTAKGIYPTISGDGLSYSEALPEKRVGKKSVSGTPTLADSRLTFEYGRWYLCVPVVSTMCDAENQGRIVALDPGIRSFQTFFSETSCGQIGKGDFSRIARMAVHLDDLLARLDPKRNENRVTAKQRYCMRRSAGKMRLRIRDLVDELHWKTCRFLVQNFDVILLPTFETKDMVLKCKRKIRKKSVRSLLTFSHFRFKMRLKNKASEFGKVVLDVDEAYTSKTASWTGEVKNIGGAKFITSGGIKVERDINGGRGIFLRSLVDHPEILQ